VGDFFTTGRGAGRVTAFEHETIGEQVGGNAAHHGALEIAAIVLLARQQNGDFLGAVSPFSITSIFR
jgi:hypothetical protein